MGSETDKDAPMQDQFSAKSNKPFSEEVVAVLNSLYTMGMIGWGKRHQDDIEKEVSMTGLDRSQIKVC